MNMGIGNFILVIISLSAFISAIKLLIKEHTSRGSEHAQIFIDLIKGGTYKMSVLQNDYPIYPGELERKDTLEYLDFLNNSDILSVLSDFEA